jgi:endosialidase-like protein
VGSFFEWKEPKHQGNLTGPQMGLIADEVEEVFPEWISVDPEGYKQLTVRGFEALVVEALRALKAENDHIKVQNQALETRVVGLETQLQASVSTHDLHNHGATR